MSFGQSQGYRIVSDEHEVDLAGFRATTWQLQQAGWRLAAEQEVREGRLQLMMRHDGLGLYGVCEEMRFNYFEWHERDRFRREDRGLHFVCRRLSVEMKVSMEYAMRFQPIDARPVVKVEPMRSIEDFKIFAPSLARTEQIIIEPQSVQECLDLIKKMQAPELAAIRERNRRRDEAPEPGPQQIFHAQILSLAA